MGKHIKEVRALFRESPVVSFASILRILKSQYAKQLVRNLEARGEIKRLAKGCYTAHDEVSLAVYCFKPAYLGLQDALSFHELWEQESIPIIITAKRVRQGIRKIYGMNVLIRRIKSEYVFGFDYVKQGVLYLPYSDIEKTFIDLVYFKQELKESLAKRINRRKLKTYLNAYPKAFRKRVLGLL